MDANMFAKRGERAVHDLMMGVAHTVIVAQVRVMLCPKQSRLFRKQSVCFEEEIVCLEKELVFPREESIIVYPGTRTPRGGTGGRFPPDLFFKLFQTCSNLFKLFQTVSNLEV